MLSVVGKCLEKIILQRLYSFKSSWFHPNQFGFTKKSNPQLALISLVNHLQKKFPNHKIYTLSLDITKAFDLAWPPKILSNLINLNCPPELLAII
jgi:hypothetical protein